MKAINNLNIPKSLIVSALCSLLTFGLNAQDKILLKNGEEVKGKVTEITDTEVKYKKIENPEGPFRVISKSEIFTITYENGSKDVFNSETKTIYVPEKENTPVIILAPAKPSPFEPDSSDFAKTRKKTFGGPRVGIALIGPGTSASQLDKEGKQPITTLFGWQFEGRLFTVENELSGLIEFVPMIAGVEQGMFIPSASVMIGLRSGVKRSIEFAMGPNFSIQSNYLGNKVGSVGLVVAAGASFNKGNINFPVNLVFVPSVGSTENIMGLDGSYARQKFQTGYRLSLVVGFNTRKK